MSTTTATRPLTPHRPTNRWRVGAVRWIGRPWGCETDVWRRTTGLVWRDWGVFRVLGEENHRGELLRWNLTNTTTGQLVTFCRSVAVAQAIAVDLEALGIDWNATASARLFRRRDARRAAVVLARWATEGDTTPLASTARQCALEAYGGAGLSALGGKP